jgi:hypothetical protein
MIKYVLYREFSSQLSLIVIDTVLGNLKRRKIKEVDRARISLVHGQMVDFGIQ